MIAVDTSVLIDFLAGRQTPQAQALERLERTNTPYSIPIWCAQEVLQGARDPAQWMRLERFLASQSLLELPGGWAACREAARIWFDCRRVGVTVRSTLDCLIAATALAHDAYLLHNDADFYAIARVRPLRDAMTILAL